MSNFCKIKGITLGAALKDGPRVASALLVFVCYFIPAIQPLKQTTQATLEI